MSILPPPNEKEAAYIAYATIVELLDVLISKGVLSRGDVDAMFGVIAERLAVGGNSSSQRASRGALLSK